MNADAKHWEHFAHGADIGIRGVGKTMTEAFEQAAVALTAVVANPERVRPVQAVDIVCAAPDSELLLVDWLNALVYEMATRHMLFSRFEIDVADNELRARAWGEPVDRQRHHPTVEVKGATYTSLSVTQPGDGSCVAQCVVDV